MSVSTELRRGRAAYERKSWTEAYLSLAAADREAGLEADDVMLLALAAMMIGRESEFEDLLERAHHAHVANGEPARAARCAFWLGMRLADQGAVSRAGGWLARAGRLLEHEPAGCVDHGYMLIPTVHRHLSARDFNAAVEAAVEAASIARRCGDADLHALALHLQGRALLGLDRINEGLTLLDEAMVGVSADEVSPQVGGLVYCSVIGACRRVYAMRRVHEWTAALTMWCEQQPDLVPFSGRCLAYRAEMLVLRGAWGEAIAEARRAAQRSTEASDVSGAAAAHYQEAEAHRLRGDAAAADAAYREARERGLEPQPGLSLLWLAEGRTAAAAAAIRRALAETTEPYARARLLPAYIEIMLAAGDISGARSACGELEHVAQQCGSDLLSTVTAHSCGAVSLAENDPLGALAALRRAGDGWEQISAPYESARVRVLLGRACRVLGDEETAALELAAAQGAFEQLGAESDLQQLASPGAAAAPTEPHAGGLTARERQVLALLATGRTNRAIATELSISERTVARHAANIFSKLGVSSRAAATAYAYSHNLVDPPA